MVVALKYLKLCTDRVNDVRKIPDSSIQCASCDTFVTFIGDNLLLGSKPDNHTLFVTSYIGD